MCIYGYFKSHRDRAGLPGPRGSQGITEPARIEILKLLVIHGGCDIGTLAEQMPQDRSVISRHLSFMDRAGLLKSSKEGRRGFQ